MRRTRNVVHWIFGTTLAAMIATLTCQEKCQNPENTTVATIDPEQAKVYYGCWKANMKFQHFDWETPKRHILCIRKWNPPKKLSPTEIIKLENGAEARLVQPVTIFFADVPHRGGLYSLSNEEDVLIFWDEIGGHSGNCNNHVEIEEGHLRIGKQKGSDCGRLRYPEVWGKFPPAD